MGRKSKLTPEIQDAICRLIRAGHFLVVAAAANGIGESTFHLWMAQGEAADTQEDKKPKKIYIEFREAVLRAEAESEMIIYNQIMKDAPPKVRLDILSRRFPQRWSPKHRHEVTGANGTPLPTGNAAPVVKIMIEGGATGWQGSFDEEPATDQGEDTADAGLTGPPPVHTAEVSR